VEQWTSGLFVLFTKKDVQNEQKPSFSLKKPKEGYGKNCLRKVYFSEGECRNQVGSDTTFVYKNSKNDRT
jgi:hypothetical protein